MTRKAHKFGSVNLEADRFQLFLGSGAGAELTLTEQRFTERNRMVAAPWGDVTLAMSLWRKISKSVVTELLDGMTAEERNSSSPSLKSGVNYQSPLVGRELAVLFWALNEDISHRYVDEIVAGWRQLAREERWWLYTRASGAEQRAQRGWRRALFYALSDAVDSLPDRESALVSKSETSRAPKGRPQRKQSPKKAPKIRKRREKEDPDPKTPQMRLF